MHIRQQQQYPSIGYSLPWEQIEEWNVTQGVICTYYCAGACAYERWLTSCLWSSCIVYEGRVVSWHYPLTIAKNHKELFLLRLSKELYSSNKAVFSLKPLSLSLLFSAQLMPRAFPKFLLVWFPALMWRNSTSILSCRSNNNMALLRGSILIYCMILGRLFIISMSFSLTTW